MIVDARAWRGLFRRIGTVTLVEPKECQTSFETACWYRLVQCPSQTVALESDGYWYRYTVHGVITKSNTPARWGAVQVVNPQDEKDVGKPATHSITGYEYNLAKWIGEPDGPQPADVRFELLPEYGAAMRVIASGGRTVGLWHLTVAEDGHPVQIARTGSRSSGLRRWSTFEVSYRGKPAGSVEVRDGQFTWQDAQRAADALVFAESGQPPG